MKRFLTYSATVASLTLLLTGCSGKAEQKQSEASAKSEQKAADQTEKGLTKVNKEKLSDKDKEQMKNEVMKWAGQEAKQKGLAASNRYFGAGEISDGDWYAMTTKSELQVSNQDEPGPKAFKRHNLVGVVMYKSNKGVTGFDKQAQHLSNIEGYKSVADVNQPIKKYLFADDGKVYEYQFKSGQNVTLSSGFAPKDHNDKDPNLKPDEIFVESKEASAKQLMQKIVKKYGKQ